MSVPPTPLLDPMRIPSPSQGSPPARRLPSCQRASPVTTSLHPSLLQVVYAEAD
ncbi:hypothetical protein BYT27DRAFT_6924570 [Phlegmacium glaucopus]|nr:hypothetical protein BYT27DRAFT_6924570 [Phlegmacium glaucopus]